MKIILSVVSSLVMTREMATLREDSPSWARRDNLVLVPRLTFSPFLQRSASKKRFKETPQPKAFSQRWHLGQSEVAACRAGAMSVSLWGFRLLPSWGWVRVRVALVGAGGCRLLAGRYPASALKPLLPDQIIYHLQCALHAVAHIYSVFACNYHGGY